MKGDFSNWRFRRFDNFSGVLHQQGRVLTDVDFTDAERIDLHWQSEAARDVIGRRVAAVPASDPDGLRITRAQVADAGGVERVVVEVHPGKLWADGVLVYLAGTTDNSSAPVPRVARYFEPPDQDPAGTPETAGDGVRDAVILELAHEELSAFQVPETLLEPALGDIDTTERIHVSFAFRLYRLGPDETCHSILPALQDGPSGKGRLTVSLTPAAEVAGDCPVPLGGGYTGFEHSLYRIEIANVPDGTAAHFKWSQFNGGLVGRGLFRAATHVCELTANRAAILNSGLNSFYLEAVRLDPDSGRWEVFFGTQATLNADNELELSDPPFFGTFPAGDQSIFLRLWNGLLPISTFTDEAAPPLRDDIHLLFDAPTATNYRPGDYWTFKVRVGQAETEPLIDSEAPHGVRFRRVPLAEIHWTDRRDTSITGSIADCRRRFRPLTNQNVCCTLLVGDGLTTFGDFNSLEEAALHLPPAGGELCLLPGTHHTNLALNEKRKVTIHGCSKQTLVFPRVANKTQPIIALSDCEEIRIEGLDLASFDGPAVHASRMRDLAIENCRILGASQNAIRIDGADGVLIAKNTLWQLDKPKASAAISFEADRVLIERNILGVVPAGREPVPPGKPGNPPGTDNPSDPCADSDGFYLVPSVVLAYIYGIWLLAFPPPRPNPYRALGGIHVRAGSEDVRIRDNRILGGAGNGITLGGELLEVDRPVDPPGSKDPEPVPITVTASRFEAVVRDERNLPVADVDLTLTDSTGVSYSERSEKSGQVLIEKVVPGTYELVSVPGVRIVQVLESAAEPVFGVKVAEGPAKAQELGRLAQIYRVEIADNEIALMGLSGIGFGVHAASKVPKVNLQAKATPPTAKLLQLLAPDDLIAISNGVDGLVIRNNRIRENLLNPFSAQMLKQAQSFGRGGISLGVCANLTIADNHVVDNGLSAVDPICGIFIGEVEDAAIAGNVIVNNGALATDAEPLRKGIRGGIFVRFALGSGLEAKEAGRPALRVHDNRVDQPAGRALTAFGLGPMSCADNYFNSESAGLLNALDPIFGCVLLVNLGGLHRYLKARLTKERFLSAEQRLAGGDTLLANNQIRLGPGNRCLCALGAASVDDLACDGNQSSIFQTRRILTNALAYAATVRVTNNRFSELVDAPAWSLWSHGRISNVTALNQADHCIITDGPPQRSIVEPNVVLKPAQCSKFAEPAGRLRYIAMVLLEAMQGELDLNEDLIASGLEFQYTEQRVGDAYVVYQQSQAAKRYALNSEVQRLSSKYGADSGQVKALATRLDQSRKISDEIGNLAEAVASPEVKPEGKGAAVAGRVIDERGRGRAGLQVQLVREDGSVAVAGAKTDAVGNFVLSFDDSAVARLSKLGKLFVSVADGEGKEVQRSSAAMSLEPDEVHRVEMKVRGRIISPTIFGRGKEVFDVRRGAAADSEPEAPSDEAEDRATASGRTPLSRVRGLGEAKIETLHEAGIGDVEALLESDLESIAKLLKMKAQTLKERAEAALEEPSEPEET